jgi:hypothetical protein
MTDQIHPELRRDSAETMAEIIKTVVTTFSFTMCVVAIAVWWIIT